MAIQLITFDLDDTLWDVAPVLLSAEAALRDWLTRQTQHLGEMPIEHLWQIRAALLEKEPALKHRISELRRRILAHALIDAGYTAAEAAALAEEGFEVFLAARHKITLFPEVQPTLEVLANRYRLAVLTNGNADVSRLGLADYFQFALCAEDLGVGKPDPRPFHEALKRGGVQPHEAVHVGDHPVDDIGGAKAAGLRAIWFNPGAKTWAGAPAPDAQICSLAELPAVLSAWHA
ncbi:HAD family hydrolase [Pseudomonas sp.]|uniref:HAD family hydrolase n=1 Tax=Pseudomonas sp. TaxID=306 RepID=UPI001A0DD877|nr:HAD family hydrolase [Pseudomonas sp.]MBF0675024.1 HAD family hydrolase [Pseudomonas sp.]